VPSDMRAIDVWMQPGAEGFLNASMFESLRRWAGVAGPVPGIPIEATVEQMDEAGVEFGLLHAWWGPSGPIISNDEIADIVARWPRRFVGVAAVDLLRPLEAVRELRRCVRDLGFKALRVVPWLWGLPPNDRHYYPLYVECIELGIPFCYQTGHTGPLAASETGRPIPYIDEVALTFPELVIVGGHIGYPWTEEMVAVVTKYPNAYIDTSAYVPSRYPEELIRYMRKRGQDKVLFGTNYPMLPLKRCVDEVDALGLDEGVRQKFLRENAVRVFNLER
jgi:predicted TIM-barrel fold metal-dependent hydrolase